MLGKMSFMSGWAGGELAITSQEQNFGADKPVKPLTKGCCKCRKVLHEFRSVRWASTWKTNLLGVTN